MFSNQCDNFTNSMDAPMSHLRSNYQKFSQFSNTKSKVQEEKRTTRATTASSPSSSILQSATACNLNNTWKKQWHLMCSVIILLLCILVKHTSEAKKTTNFAYRFWGDPDELYRSDIGADLQSSKF